MEYEIVVGRLPRHAQRMRRQDDEADGAAGQGAHFHRVGDRKRRIANLKQGDPGAQVFLDYTKRCAVVVHLADPAARSAETGGHLPAGGGCTLPLGTVVIINPNELGFTGSTPGTSHRDSPAPNSALPFDPLPLDLSHEGWTKDPKAPLSPPLDRCAQDEEAPGVDSPC